MTLEQVDLIQSSAIVLCYCDVTRPNIHCILQAYCRFITFCHHRYQYLTTYPSLGSNNADHDSMLPGSGLCRHHIALLSDCEEKSNLICSPYQYLTLLSCHVPMPCNAMPINLCSDCPSSEDAFDLR